MSTETSESSTKDRRGHFRAVVQSGLERGSDQHYRKVPVDANLGMFATGALSIFLWNVCDATNKKMGKEKTVKSSNIIQTIQENPHLSPLLEGVDVLLTQ